MKIKIKRILLTAAITAAMIITSAAPSMAETVSDDLSGAPEDVLVISPAPTAAATVKWTSTKLKATKMDLTKVASYSYNKIKLTWEPLSGVDGYQIYRATTKTGTYTKVTTITDPTRSTYINGSRTCGKTYYYKIRAYKKMNGKTVYSKYSSILSAYAKPAKVTINDVYGDDYSLINVTVDWKAVSGATGYEQQVNQFMDGKWTGWRTYTFGKDGNKETFDTYASLLSIAKKQNPSGYITEIKRVDGKNVIETISVEESVARSIKKTQAWLDIVQDDSIYKFRVRAYRIVNGKKIYGSWSKEYTLTETLDVNEILAELKAYTIEYAKANNPMFTYDNDTDGRTVRNSSYYIEGIFGGFSRYARQEDVIEGYKDNIERYVDKMSQESEQTAFIYIERWGPGSKDYWGNVEKSTEAWYKIWMLY